MTSLPMGTGGSNIVGRVVVEITGDNAPLNAKLTESQQKAESAAGGIGGFFAKGATAAVIGTTAALTGLAGAVGVVGFGYASMMQQAEIGFTTMLGSAEKAESFLDGLAKFAATTPFEFPELVSASQRLLAFGFEAEKIIPMMTQIGDASAGLGLGSAGIDRITRALGQMQAKGKVSSQEMMQLAEAGIPAWQYLADAIGVSIPEAMKMAEKGAIEAGPAIEGILEGMGESFGGLMEKQSKTWSGMLSTIKDTFSQISGSIMAPFFQLAQDGLAKFAAFFTNPAFAAAAEKFGEKVASTMKSAISIIGEFFSMIGPIVSSFFDGFSKAKDIISDFFYILTTGTSRMGLDTGVWAALQKIAFSLHTTVQSLAKGFLQLLNPTMKSSEVIANLTARGRDFASISGLISEIIGQLTRGFSAFWENLFGPDPDRTSNGFVGFMEQAGLLARELISSLERFAMAVGPAFFDLIKAAAPILMDMAAQFASLAGTLALLALQYLPDVVDLLADILVPALQLATWALQFEPTIWAIVGAFAAWKALQIAQSFLEAGKAMYYTLDVMRYMAQVRLYQTLDRISTWAGLMSEAFYLARIRGSELLDTLKGLAASAVNKTVTITQNIVSGAGTLLTGLGNVTQTITQHVTQTGDKLITDFKDKTQNIIQNIEIREKIKLDPTEMAKKFVMSFAQGVMQGLGIALGAVIAAALAVAGTTALIVAAAALAAILVGVLIYVFRDEIWTFLTKTVPKLFSDAADIIVDGLETAWNNIPEAIGAIAALSVAAFLAPWAAAYLGIKALIEDILIPSFEFLAEVATTAFAGLETGFNAFLGFLESIPGALESGIGAFISFISSIPGYLESAVSSAVSFASELASTVGGGLSEAASAVVEFASSVPGMVFNELSKLPGIIGDLVSGFWRREVEGWKRIIEGDFVGGINQILMGVPAAFTSALSSVPGIVQSAFNSVVGFATSMASEVPAQISAMASAVLGHLSSLAGSIASWLGEQVSAISNWGIVQAVEGIAQDVIAGFNFMFGEIDRIFDGELSKIVSAFSSAAISIVNEVSRWPGMIINALGNLGSLLYNAGRDIVQGLINGLNSKAGDLIQTVTTLGGLIPAWKGPPEKDRKMLTPAGNMIMEGLTRGLREGWEHTVRPYLESLSVDGLPSAFNPDLPMATISTPPSLGGGQTQGSTFIFEIAALYARDPEEAEATARNLTSLIYNEARSQGVAI